MHCPECGEEIADDSRYCRACGADVTPPDSEGTPSARESSGESGEESDGKSGIVRAVYWGGRIAQVLLVAVAVLTILGSFAANVNVIAFAALGVFALVLFGVVGAIELLLIRPLS